MPDEPSRPKFSPAAKPAPVREDIPEAVRLLRERKKRGQFKTSKVVIQERQRKKKAEWNWLTGSPSGWVITIVGLIIMIIYKLFIQER